MNFRKNGPRVEPNMAALAQQIDKPEPIDYAPPAIRNGVLGDEQALRQIASFGELPTKEIDEIMSAAVAEIEELKRTCQLVRNLYVKAVDQVTADAKRLREGVRLSMKTLETLREQCLALNVNEIVETEREMRKDVAEAVVQHVNKQTERELRDLAKSDDQPAQ
jgi:aspartate ammonia-lyase